MSKQGTQVLEEALSLPPAERAELVDRLLTSLDSSSQRRIDELWALEAEERLDALERGEIKTLSLRSLREGFAGANDVKR